MVISPYSIADCLKSISNHLASVCDKEADHTFIDKSVVRETVLALATIATILENAKE